MVSFSAIRAYHIYQHDPIVRRIDFDDPDPPVIEAPPVELICRVTPPVGLRAERRTRKIYVTPGVLVIYLVFIYSIADFSLHNSSPS